MWKRLVLAQSLPHPFSKRTLTVDRQSAVVATPGSHGFLLEINVISFEELDELAVDIAPPET